MKYLHEAITNEAGIVKAPHLSIQSEMELYSDCVNIVV